MNAMLFGLSPTALGRSLDLVYHCFDGSSGSRRAGLPDPTNAGAAPQLIHFRIPPANVMRSSAP